MADKKKQDELILEAKNFFDSYKKEIGESIRSEEHVVKLSFPTLAEFSPILSERIIEFPEETIAILETALEESGLVKKPRT